MKRVLNFTRTFILSNQGCPLGSPIQQQRVTYTILHNIPILLHIPLFTEASDGGVGVLATMSPASSGGGAVAMVAHFRSNLLITNHAES